jgi:hypothetical protein
MTYLPSCSNLAVPADRGKPLISILYAAVIFLHVRLIQVRSAPLTNRNKEAEDV